MAILQTDHKALFKKLEEKLHELHAIQKQINILEPPKPTSKTQNSDVEMSIEESKTPATHPPKENYIEFPSKPSVKSAKEWVPFLWVGTVEDESPAWNAGIRQGDAIVKFEEVTHEHEGGLAKVAEIVKYAENMTLNVKVLRKCTGKG